MNQYAIEDQELPHIKVTNGAALWVCIDKDCDGEHHVYVRSA